MSTKTQKEFIEEIAKGVEDRWEKYRLLPSVGIAQSILESNWGKSDLAVKANNLFGVKGDFNGFGYRHLTWEVIDGKRHEIYDWFKHYPSRIESIKDQVNVFHGSDWRKSHYSKVIGEQDYKKATQALTGTYATDPDYGTKLVKIIEDHNLTQYDPVFEDKKEEELKRVRIENLPTKNVADFYVSELKAGGITDAFTVTEENGFTVQAGSFKTQEQLDKQVNKVKDILTKRLKIV